MIENEPEQTPVNVGRTEVPPCFEAAHVEWLKLGGQNICHKYRHGSQQGFYKTAYWKLVSEAVFRRDGDQCRRCGEAAFQVHHLNYLHRGEDHLYPENLVSVCRRCHLLVEFARHAQSRLYSFRHRQRVIQRFVAGEPAHETPLKSLSRVLEFAAQVETLRSRYEHVTDCAISELKTMEPSGATLLNAAQLASLRSEAKTILDSWKLTEKEKYEGALAMATEETKKCTEFIAQALGAISIPANPPLSQRVEGRTEGAISKRALTGQESLGKCPACGGLVFETGVDYVCENRVTEKSLCDLRIPKVILSQLIDRAQVSKLLVDGKTDVLNGFMSAAGQPFSAYLAMDGRGKVTFKFTPQIR